MTSRQTWLAQYPSLQPMADLHGLISSMAAETVVPSPRIPSWPDYSENFYSGTPLLRSSKVIIDLGPAEHMLVSLVQKFYSTPLLKQLTQQSRVLATELRSSEESPGLALAWVLGKNVFSSAEPGLLRYVGWTVLCRYLSRLTEEFGSWRDEERWLRNYCPMCGAAPAMAQLVGIDPGRQRFLSCGCCATRWRYRRTECPFCEKDNHRLATFTFNGSRLRIDYCEACGGYLKTYDGQGGEDVLLGDWTSLHLDMVACDRGLKRFAESLYQL